MYKLYTQSRGIEFRMGVREKILLAVALGVAVTVVMNFDRILEVIIAGF